MRITKKAITSFILIFYITTINGQSGFLNANYSYSVLDNDSVELYSETSFSFGYGQSTCPDLVFLEVDSSNSTLYINTFYDTRGLWPQVGCTAIDTSRILNNFNEFALVLVNTNLITIDSVITDSVIAHVDTDTLAINSLNNLSYQKNEQVHLYPNPATDFFKLGTYGVIKEVTIHDYLGRRLKTYNGNREEYYIADLPPGTYLVRITTEEGPVLKRLVKTE